MLTFQKNQISTGSLMSIWPILNIWTKMKFMKKFTDKKHIGLWVEVCGSLYLFGSEIVKRIFFIYAKIARVV